MTALPPVPDVLRLRLQWHIAENIDVGTSLHFSYSGGPPSDTDATTLAAAGLVEAVAHLYPLLSSANSLEFVGIQDLSSPSGGFGTSGAGTVGSRSGGPLPVGAAVLASCSIRRKYRGGKPRNYWPLGTDSDLADGTTWTGGAVSAFNSGIAGFISGMVGQVGGSTVITGHVNVSYYSGYDTSIPPWRGPGFKYPPKLRAAPVVDPITGVGVSGKPGSQRRRYQR